MQGETPPPLYPTPAPAPPPPPLRYLHYIFKVFALIMEHYPRPVDRLYLLNAPPAFAHAWSVLKRALDDWIRERIVFVRSPHCHTPSSPSCHTFPCFPPFVTLATFVPPLVTHTLLFLLGS